MAPYDKDKAHDYYSRVRTDLFRLVPNTATIRTVLDVGCGAGANAPAYREMGAVRICGVELLPEAAAQARVLMDQVICGSIESVDLPPDWQRFDLIVCADVLEHLVRPDLVLQKLAARLQDRGLLLLSVPTIASVYGVYEILVRRDFEYTESGLFDATHLRFFTKRSVRRLLTSARLEPILWGYPRLSRRFALINLVFLGLFRDFLALQHYVLAKRGSSYGG